MHVITIETPSLGDRTYVVHDRTTAIVIDPQRDIDRIVAAAADADVQITHIAETHLHNDYVSGGLTLARVTGASYLHAAAESLRFDHRAVGDGDVVHVGSLTVQVRATPGHTPHHLAYVVTAHGFPPAVFTGGSMLYGTVGRTDLIGADHTDALTRAQYRSVHQLADDLPDEAHVYPTHGFGSFCASASSDDDSDGSLGTERAVNIALTADDEDDFVERLLAGLDDYPAYYAHMGPLNQSGAVAVDLSPAAVTDPVEIARRIHRGEWVVDLRPRRHFALSHLAGTIGVELSDGFSTYLAWLVPWGMPVTLLADDPDAVAEAQRQLVRVGIDRPAGSATGGIERWGLHTDRSHYPVVRFDDVGTDDTILDVRRRAEYSASHLDGATNVPLHEILDRIGEVPEGHIHVHCESGFRASIAASLLDRAGHDVTLVDDEFAHAVDSGRPLTHE